MKLAILADVHGNRFALEAVLNDIKKRNISTILVAGDLITDFLDNNQVMDELFTLTPYIIKGNREDYLLDWPHSQHEGLHQFSPVEWSYHDLLPHNMARLTTMTATMELALSGRQILMFHGSPVNISEILFPQKNRDRILTIMEQYPADILIGAHCHRPYVLRHHHQVMINPGSVGVSFNGQREAEYAIVELENLQVELLQVPYDFAALQHSLYESSLFKAAPAWCQMTLRSIDEGYNHNSAFIRQFLAATKEVHDTERLNQYWDDMSRIYLAGEL